MLEMSDVPSDSIYHKLCAQCQTPKLHYQFYRNNEWCKDCIGQAQQNVPPGKKFCLDCKDTKAIGEFPVKTLHGKARSTPYCKLCVNKRKKTYQQPVYNPQVARERSLRQNYGITLDEYNALYQAQGGVCAICKLPERIIDWYTKEIRALCVDHSHVTGAIRGLLCDQCNQALGLLKEDPELVQSMLNYIHERVLW